MCVLFPKPHMDPPVVIACVFFSKNHTWIHQWSLHVCSFHKPHIDQPLESLHVCSFPQTTYGSTSGHCMCVLSTNHMWTHYSHCMCVISTNHTWINHYSHCICVISTNHTWINH